MSENTENAETIAAEQQVHPEVARVQNIVAQAVQALTQCQTILYDVPKIVAGNISLAAEVERLKAEIAKAQS